MADYGTLAGSIAYHTERGNTAWTASTSILQEAAKLRASIAIDNKYRLRFPGKKTLGRAQVREWPRTDAYDYAGEELTDAEIPIEIEQATYEGALRELVSPGSLSPDYKGSAQVKRERKKVGQLEKEIEYFDGSNTFDASIPIFSIIDGILASLLLPPPSKSTVVFLKRA